ncbi:PE family protein, partial [Mycobacterium interjectum]|nr:PE family protein [Mycobacterium interjectum]
MSFVVTAPDLLSAAAGRLQVIGSTISAANATAAFPITGVIPAAADEVSAATAAAFSGYGQVYQAISAEAALIHEEFVRALGLGAHSYAATEVANATQAAGGQVPAVPARMAPTAPARPAMPARMA